jgi:hypothetical protein
MDHVAVSIHSCISFCLKNKKIKNKNKKEEKKKPMDE